MGATAASASVEAHGQHNVGIRARGELAPVSEQLPAMLQNLPQRHEQQKDPFSTSASVQHVTRAPNPHTASCTPQSIELRLESTSTTGPLDLWVLAMAGRTYLKARRNPLDIFDRLAERGELVVRRIRDRHCLARERTQVELSAVYDVSISSRAAAHAVDPSAPTRCEPVGPESGRPRPRTQATAFAEQIGLSTQR